MNILGFIKVSALYAGVVLILGANYAWAESEVRSQARQQCVAYHTANPVGASIRPSAICGAEQLLTIFSSPQDRRVYDSCYRFMSAHRGEGESAPLPFAVCMQPNKMRIFRSESLRRAFEECHVFMEAHRIDEVASPSAVCEQRNMLEARSTPGRRRAYDACHMFMESHRDNEGNIAPSVRCISLANIFSSPEQTLRFAQCVEDGAVGRGSYAPSVYCAAVVRSGLHNNGAAQSRGATGSAGGAGD